MSGWIWCFILIQLSGLSAWGALHPRSQIFQRSQGISAELVAAYETTQLRPWINPEIFLPKNMASLASGQVAAAMLDAGVNHWLQSPEVRSTVFGRTAQAMEQSLKQEVSWGGSAASESDDSDGASIRHKLSFNILPVQAQARIQYEGLLRAQIAHTVSDRSTHVELAHALDQRQELVLSEIRSPERVSTQLGYRLSF